MKSIEERGTAATPTLITSFHVSAKRERNRRGDGALVGFELLIFSLMDVSNVESNLDSKVIHF